MLAPSSFSIARSADSSGAMADFDWIVVLMKRRHGVRIRRWRANMTGCAWQVRYANGRIIHWIEAPKPRTAISLCIFLHEVGHHVIGFDVYKRRCEEEYYAWQWAIDQMRELGVEPDARTLARFHLSMQYAVGKAMRRGIKSLPAPLMRFAAAA
jgi:hypothetical protein